MDHLNINNIKKYCLHIAGEDIRKENIKKIKNTYDIFSNLEIKEFAKTKLNTKIGNIFNGIKTPCYKGIYNGGKRDIFGSVFSCSYNHLQIIKCAYDNNEQHVFIMEDDVHPICTNKHLHEIMNEIPEDVDLCKFYIPKFYTVNESYKVIEDNNFFLKIEVIKKHLETLLPTINCSNAFYLLSRKCMKYYIESAEKELYPADIQFDYIPNDINYYILKENVFEVSNDTTII